MTKVEGRSPFSSKLFDFFYGFLILWHRSLGWNDLCICFRRNLITVFRCGCTIESWFL